MDVSRYEQRIRELLHERLFLKVVRLVAFCMHAVCMRKYAHLRTKLCWTAHDSGLIREGAAGLGGEKNGKIYLIRALKYIFLFVSKTGCFLLRVIFQCLKTVQKCKIGSDLVRFEFQIAKMAQSIGWTSYAEAKKSAERSSKRRIELQKGGWHFVYFMW